MQPLLWAVLGEVHSVQPEAQVAVVPGQVVVTVIWLGTIPAGAIALR